MFIDNCESDENKSGKSVAKNTHTTSVVQPVLHKRTRRLTTLQVIAVERVLFPVVHVFGIIGLERVFFFDHGAVGGTARGRDTVVAWDPLLVIDPCGALAGLANPACVH